jgi:N-acetylneuraminate synthase
MTATPEPIAIGPRLVGDGSPCFVIAEAGSNHDGDLQQALALIDAAARAGADAVKFQVFRASKLYPRTAGQTDYLGLDRPIRDVIADMEMPYEWLDELAERARTHGLVFMASAFDVESVERLDPYVEAHKIASYELAHHPLVAHVAGLGKPLILSTGTSGLGEIAEAVEVFRRAGGTQLALLQCTAAYPAPLESLNVAAIDGLHRHFGVPTGLSDHSRDPVIAPVLAVGVGASILEKHFTLSNALPGPDHAFALEPDELALMVERVRAAEQALGSPDKAVHPVELELRAFARPSLFTSRAVAAGQPFTTDDVIVLRKGRHADGLHPRELARVLAARSARNLPVESPITEDALA